MKRLQTTNVYEMRDDRKHDLRLSPREYEELREALKLQPARVLDSQGAHYESS